VEEVGDRPVSRDLSLRQRGFTIIEILLVIVIIGVFLAIAAPSFVTYTSSQKVKTASFDMYAAMMFARSEAIKRRKCVSVTPTSSSNWITGWSVREVVSPTCVLDSTVDTILRTQDALSGVTFTTSSASVVYRLDGRLTVGTPVAILIEPQIADSSIQNRCVRVDPTGLPKTTNISSTICP
jgi:type IV fimbrial biogenesis protein FimT